MKTIVISVDGVLAKRPRDDSFAASQPTADGKMLYHSLASFYRVVLHHPDEDEAVKVKWWLTANGISTYADLVYGPVDEAVYKALRKGAPAFWVTGKTDEATAIAGEGVPILFYAQPAFVRSEFKSNDRSLTSWDSLVEEMNEQFVKYSETIKQEDDGRFER